MKQLNSSFQDEARPGVCIHRDDNFCPDQTGESYFTTISINETSFSNDINYVMFLFPADQCR